MPIRRKPIPKNQTNAIKFVKIWQTSQSAMEAAERLGIHVNSAFLRAKKYRDRGVPLKKMPRSPAIDWAAIAELAAGLVEDNDGEKMPGSLDTRNTSDVGPAARLGDSPSNGAVRKRGRPKKETSQHSASGAAAELPAMDGKAVGRVGAAKG